MHIKDAKVTNPKNVVVQIPGFVVNKWNLDKMDRLEVHYDEATKSILIRPKEVCTGSDTHIESEIVAGNTTGHSLLQSIRQVSQRRLRLDTMR